MRNAVRFHAAAFNGKGLHAPGVNGGDAGADLGRWLRGRLEARGYRVDGPEPAEWGWYLDCAAGGGWHTLCIGRPTDPAAGWQLLLEREPSLADRFFGRAVELDSRLAADLHQLLAGTAGIEGIQWLSLDARGREAGHAAQP